ncbi:MAG: tetratricopeptide repeat protein [Spirochaetaceae bacterium]|nr:tetratricopeptide repeat protein [Spirochaetaceae bacterium]
MLSSETMARRRPSPGTRRTRILTGAAKRAAAFASVLAGAILLASGLASCSSPRSAYLVGTREQKTELAELFAFLDANAADPVERFAAARQISNILLREKEYGRLTALLTGLAAERGSDPYVAWYLFAAAYAYDQAGSAPIAALYYDRIVKNLPDLEVDGKSIHHECLQRLIEAEAAPERRIEYYKDLIARFPERIDMGRILFLLGKEYEHVGDWNLAVKTYAKFLPYFGASIPGHPDAFQYARNVIEFYNSPKDWAYEDLQTLVGNIKAALAAGDPYKLRRYRAKVNFFAMSWHQDETDVNSQVLFDFAEFMSGGRIYAAPELDASSGPREAYLKTWGWSERLSTWYLYFRKVYFPADPEIHGRWEWAGIYFGDKMQ